MMYKRFTESDIEKEKITGSSGREGHNSYLQRSLQEIYNFLRKSDFCEKGAKVVSFKYKGSNH